MNPVSYFIARNGQQLGPLSSEQIAQMQATGQIAPQDMVWHEGMNGWQTAQIVFGPAAFPTPPPPPVFQSKKNSPLGWASLVIGAVMFFGWFALLIAAGLAHNAGANEESPVMVVIGLLLFASVGLNVLGIVLGIIPCTKSDNPKTVAVIGILLNALELVGMAGLMVLGIAMQ